MSCSPDVAVCIAGSARSWRSGRAEVPFIMPAALYPRLRRFDAAIRSVASVCSCERLTADVLVSGDRTRNRHSSHQREIEVLAAIGQWASVANRLRAALEYRCKRY